MGLRAVFIEIRAPSSFTVFQGYSFAPERLAKNCHILSAADDDSITFEMQQGTQTTDEHSQILPCLCIDWLSEPVKVVVIGDKSVSARPSRGPSWVPVRDTVRNIADADMGTFHYCLVLSFKPSVLEASTVTSLQTW